MNAPADILARLDAEETRLLTELAEVRGAKATLRRLCGLTDPPHGPVGLPPEVPPGKPEPRPARAESGATRHPDRALAIARAMLAGAKGVIALSRAVGLSEPTVLTAIRGRPDWFQKESPHARAPWVLTEAGRAAAAPQAAAPGSDSH